MIQKINIFLTWCYTPNLQNWSLFAKCSLVSGKPFLGGLSRGYRQSILSPANRAEKVKSEKWMQNFLISLQKVSLSSK